MVSIIFVMYCHGIDSHVFDLAYVLWDTATRMFFYLSVALVTVFQIPFMIVKGKVEVMPSQDSSLKGHRL